MRSVYAAKCGALPREYSINSMRSLKTARGQFKLDVCSADCNRLTDVQVSECLYLQFVISRQDVRKFEIAIAVEPQRNPFLAAEIDNPLLDRLTRSFFAKVSA